MTTPSDPAPIWKYAATPAQLNQAASRSMSAHIGMKIVEVGANYVVGTLPVDHRTVQPMGRLHGGANVVLAEELGSLAANLCLDPALEFAVGLDINANHLRGVTSGQVTGTARPVHIGRTTQVWEIHIVDDTTGKLACISRLTMAVLAHKR